MADSSGWVGEEGRHGDSASLSDGSIAQAVAWHRQVAAMVEAADRAGVATEDLPGLRTRMAIQAEILAQGAARLGSPLPALLPTPAEIATAGSALGDLSAAAINGAVRTMRTTLATVDSVLGVGATVPAGEAHVRTAVAVPPPQPTAVAPLPQPSTPDISSASTALAGVARQGPFLRNAIVYGTYAAAVLAVQAVLFVLLDEVSELPAAAPLCLLVLPAMAWLAGFLTIGALFPAKPGQKLKRTPRLGVVICLIPNALLCGTVGVLFLVN